jgi:hypothetical protein
LYYQDTNYFIEGDINMTTEKTNKKARTALLLYTLLGVMAIGVSFIVDFANNEGVTWSLYVLYAVPVLFLGMIPLCFRAKGNVVLSAAVLSIASFPLLYLLDSVSAGSDWFSPLALPVAARFVAGLWIGGVLLKILPMKNKWYLGGALLLVFGLFMSSTTLTSVEAFTGNTLSQFSRYIGVLSSVVAGIALASVGYFTRQFKGKLSNA